MSNFYQNHIPWEVIAKVLSGNADVSEKQNLEQWTEEQPENKDIFEELSQNWKEWSRLGSAQKEAEQLDLIAAWTRLSQRLGIEELQGLSPKKGGLLRIYSRKWAVAASVILLLSAGTYLGLPYFMSKGKANEPTWLSVSNELKDPKTVQMPDGSTIVLNVGSTLQYPDRFDQRIIKLRGEAYFEVQPDPAKPFEVYFGTSSKVKVLGTSFNISAPDNSQKLSVTVLSGKVSFEANERQSVVLQGGDAANFYIDQARIEQKQDHNATAWKTGILKFEDLSIGEILPILEKHFEANFEVSDSTLLRCRFKGTFEQESLEHILGNIAFGLDANIQQKGNTYRIEGIGCEPEN